MPVIALLTDFGLNDPYVGILKGVLSQHAPHHPILDLTHGIPPQDIRTGALFLESSLPYFPEETIFVCVVDPGVGSQRKPILRRYANRWLVGPDNGLCSLGAGPDLWWEIEPERWLGPLPSHTFHGRDLFAPTAARLAHGTSPELLGRPHPTPIRLNLPQPQPTPTGFMGEILYFDHYGNAITNLSPAPDAHLQLAQRDLPLQRTYSDVAPGVPIALVGSTGRIEVSIREGNARQELQLWSGQPIALHTTRAP